MNRVCFMTRRQSGDLVKIVSDLPFRVVSVSEDASNNRVFEFTPGVGVLEFGEEQVDRVLADDPVGHHFDDQVEDSWGRAMERAGASVCGTSAVRPSGKDE